MSVTKKQAVTLTDKKNGSKKRTRKHSLSIVDDEVINLNKKVKGKVNVKNSKLLLKNDIPLKKIEPDLKSTLAKQEDGDNELQSSQLSFTTNKSENSTKSKKISSAIKKDEETSETQVTNEYEEGESDDYKWWEADLEDDTEKWQTLVHNGVLFPPEYEALPNSVNLIYDGKPIKLPIQAEEVAGFFGAMINTDHAKNPVFQANFFRDFQLVLKESGGVLEPSGLKITDFNKCNFEPIFDYYESKREEKKQLSRAEKKALKDEKEKLEEPYKFCYLNGRKEQVGNFRVEPPSLFRGRGQHPKTGSLKRRVFPEDIILNLDKNAKVPELPVGHKWGEVKHDNTVQWLAMWKENIFNSFKYVRFAANSSLKGISDYKKFEKARELKNHIEKIRKDYNEKLHSKVTFERQIAVATYLIDVFALRAGGEKGEDEADTVGCCSLRYEHISLTPPNNVTFDFLGKDSIRFFQEVTVDKQVFKSLKLFKKAPKKSGDQLFDRLDPSILNKHLQNYMPGLTAKVFRTYNASKTMQDQLDGMNVELEQPIQEKILQYNAANREVAILCNHQRSVGKNHEASVQKAGDKIEELVWQKIRFKRALLQLNPGLKESDGKHFKDVWDLTKEKELEIIKRVSERDLLKFKRKFDNENEKKKEINEELLPETQLEEWMKKVNDQQNDYIKEVENDGKLSDEFMEKNNKEDKLREKIQKLEQRIVNANLQLKDKEDNSQVSLGTSKINYIDPRLSVVFCKRFNVPIEKIFTKTLRDKFKWAIESVDDDWRF
ncbi:hypothetical protein QEN19_000294 [Hanseniaspora menglaensis]